MLSRRNFIAISFVASMSITPYAQAAWWSFLVEDDNTEVVEDNATEIQWSDLIPDDFVQPENPYESMTAEEIDKLMDGSDESRARIAEIDATLSYAPVVPDLDGKRVRIPAYMTPLEYDGGTQIKEFLLVPYVGACIHVPPPPANQVVHVESPNPIKFTGMNEAVWATGIIRTDKTQTELAVTGYSLEIERIEPYEARRKKRTLSPD